MSDGVAYRTNLGSTGEREGLSNGKCIVGKHAV